MTYPEFLRFVRDNGLTLEQVRCDVPPNRDVRDLLAECGEKYERFVLRYERSLQSPTK